MRIWDLPPRKLCRQHLLGEHRELHAIWSILSKGKRGYRSHPETVRWKGALRALYARHALLVGEMGQRGYLHKSNLDKRLAKGAKKPRGYVDPPHRQRMLIKRKGCECRV